MVDKRWLDNYNVSKHLTPDAFELIMDRIEKEWFLLVIYSYNKSHRKNL